MSKSMKIGELAHLAGCPVQTVRYYEREGLLPKANRSSGNYRIYDERLLERLQLIRHCRYLDMALDEVKLLLKFSDAPKGSCHEVNALLDEHIGHVAQRVAELQALERRLKKLRRMCRRAQASQDCGILNELAHAASWTPGQSGTMGHVRGTHGHAASGKE